MKRRSQQAVALIITLILLSVITFMTVTFLAVSRREKSSVTTTTDQNMAQMAADAAMARAEAQMLAPMIAFTNPASFGLLVSTNFINWNGFDPNAADYRTNVNYDTLRGGGPLNQNQLLQNLASLLYDPRPPVFVTNRLNGTTEFRYYLDLNRNGRYDTNGLWPALSSDPANPYYDTNGNTMPTIKPGNTLSNYFVGDPEWIGVLERPDQPHSAVNRFVARYAFIAIPTGDTLDLNYIHNHAKNGTSPLQDGFFRNQGVGSWEINLAGFLADLNTNQWDAAPNQYQYNLDLSTSSSGTAFDDARELLRWRDGGNYRNLDSVRTMFGFPGANAFGRDMIDGYTQGPLMTNYWGWNVVQDPDPTRVTASGWSGASTPSHFFSTQDLFDRQKTAISAGGNPNTFTFTDRLLSAGAGTNSYDRYTYYRLLSQLGTDSAPDPATKMNLNYDNLTQASATNFVDWQPLTFFANAADRMLRAQFGFGVGNIPVYTNNTFVYTPSIHRVLQLAANIYDATTNALYPGGPTTYPYLPSVFRPILNTRSNAVYIVGFTNDVGTLDDLEKHAVKDLSDSNIVLNVGPNDMVFGVPLVIGVKKGLPNFNEFSMESVSQISRRLQIIRPKLDAPISQWKTNQMFIVGVSNAIGVEFWNSYSNNYTRSVEVYFTNFLSMTLTNDRGYSVSLPPPAVYAMPGVPRTQTNFWRGYSGLQSLGVQDKASFISFRTNVVFQPEAVYWYNANQLYTNLSTPYESGAENLFPQPQWGVGITNRFLAAIVDHSSGRLIDYVQLNGLNDHRDLLAEMATNDYTGMGFSGLWATNRENGTASLSDYPMGVVNQYLVSMGNFDTPSPQDWTLYGYLDPQAPTKDWAIANFRAFYSPSHRSSFKGISANNTNLIQEVPFVPVKRMSKSWTWQANDPLVHYMANDLLYLEMVTTNSASSESLKVPVPTLPNIGLLNDRYKPWGRYQDPTTDPDSYNTALKDPGVAKSEDWQFPTNKFPTIGWLGRVHRGTPWQTVYLKSSDILSTNGGLKTWQRWTGNQSADTNRIDAAITTPIQDRLIFDLFTTAFSDNASRGQLPINQPGLAAWSAVFDGVVALTLTNKNIATWTYGWTNIQPAGSFGTNSAVWQLVNGPNGINATRANTNRFPGGAFQHLGDILSVPALTDQSPFLSTPLSPTRAGMTDAAYEWLPEQIMSLLRVGTPRFVIYAYGQALHPADRSVVTFGPSAGICTNYQVTAETATRAVVRFDPVIVTNSINPLNLSTNYSPVIESYNILPPD